MALLEVNGIFKRFGKTEVLNGIDFSMEKGEVLAIIGSSGSGKTTLLRCLNFLETPDAGSMILDGEELYNASCKYSDRDIRAKRLHFGLVFQSFNLFNNMSVLKNCMVGQMKVLKRSKEEARQQALKYLEKVGMAPYINAKPRQISGGQKQRVAIARALATDPEILYFDEPTSALDPELTGEVLAVMRQLAEEGMTMLVVTHEMGFARGVSSKTVFMENGVVVEAAPSQEFFAHPKEERTREFLRKIEHTN